MPDLRLGTVLPSVLELGTTNVTRVYQGNTRVWPPVLQAPAGRLVYVNPTQVAFQPYNGNRIAINGTDYTIPSGGVTLASTGLTVGGVYYIYCYNNVGTLTLEASSTGHSLHTDGHECKTGFGTHRLVGIVRIGGGTVFDDDPTIIGVLSWHNRRWRSLRKSFSGILYTTSASFVEIGTEIRCYFLAWADVGMCVDFSAPAGSSDTAGAYCNVQLAVDGTLYNPISSGRSNTTGYYQVVACAQQMQFPADGFHYATVYASQVLGGTATIHPFGTLSVRVFG